MSSDLAYQSAPLRALGSSRTLLITVGSTLFPALTDLALSPAFLKQLTALGAEKLVVQYGKAEIVLPPAVEWHERDHRAGSGSFVFGQSLTVSFLRFTDDFQGLVEQAQWVISHAGSGSILTVGRTPRSLMVVPNPDLMDNHQAELADALGAEDYVLVSSIPKLLHDLPRLLSPDLELRAFPRMNQAKFAAILDETAGFVP